MGHITIFKIFSNYVKTNGVTAKLIGSEVTVASSLAFGGVFDERADVCIVEKGSDVVCTVTTSSTGPTGDVCRENFHVEFNKRTDTVFADNAFAHREFIDLIEVILINNE